MKNYLILLAICLTTSWNSNAQAPDWSWVQSTGSFGLEYGYQVATDAGGNCFVAGAFSSPEIQLGPYTLSGNETNDVFLVKYDQTGNALWAKSGTGSSDEFAYGIATDEEGNCYITGIFISATIEFDDHMLTNVGGSDIFIVKYNSEGTVVWAKSYGGNLDDYVYSIAIAPNNEAYIAGTFFSNEMSFASQSLTNTGEGFWEAYVAKLDENGDPVWVRSAEGEFDDYCFGIDVDAAGNCYITGHFWSHSIDMGEITLNNNNPDDFADAFVVKMDTDGEVMWAHAVGGSNSDLGRGIAVDDAGNSFVAGYYSSPSIIIETTTLSNVGVSDLFLLKYDTDGNLIWARSDGELDYDKANDITLDLQGNCYVTGFFTGFSITFGTTTLPNNNPGSDALYVVKYTGDGDVSWATSANGQHIADGLSIATDIAENCYVSGSFNSSTMTFDGIMIFNGGGDDMFVAKLGNLLIGQHEIAVTKEFVIAPNPMCSQSTFYFKHDVTGSTIILSDLTGKLIREIQIKGNSFVLERNGLPSGFYLTQLIEGNRTNVPQKLIID